MISNVLLGSDPEFIVFNPKTGLSFPGLDFTTGDKENPFDIGGGFYIQKDNALLEGNIPPAATREAFIEHMSFLIGYLNFLVNPAGLTIIHEDVGVYAKKHLKSPEVNIFGCDPYDNVWDGETHRAPSLSDKNYRTCGFHIHIGYSLDTTEITREEMNKFLVKSFDLHVVLPSYLISFDPRRASSYGGLGQFRHKSYGVECRSLGGYFTRLEMLSWVWDKTMEAIDFCKDTKNLEVLKSLPKLEDLSKDSIQDYLEEFAEKVGVLTS